MKRIKMAARQEYSLEELNYLRICHVTTRIITEELRVLFKQLWDTRHKTKHGEWQDTARNGTDLYSMESPKSRRRNSQELAILRNGNSNEWDCTCLFFAILYSDSIGKGLDAVVKKGVDELRQFRNKVFAHVSDGKLTELNFQTSIQTVIAAFRTLKLNTADIEAIKNQKSFPTEELRVIKQQLDKEKMRNEEPRSFWVLPPKPSHEVIDRPGQVTKILEEMKRLRSTKTNEITVVYVSGNPGCGKSEIARQIGEKVFDDDPENVTDQVKFVFALNASSTDTLIPSYLELAICLKCDENSATSIGTSKDLSQEDKLIYLKSLVAPKLRKYSSWLLIVDNVTDVKSVFKYLPRAGEAIDGNGQILVTTQDSRSIGANDSHSYHLSLSRGMNQEEAIRTLSEISGIVSDECTLRVAQDLDFQPLALACAATYMKRVRRVKPSMSWEEYLQKLQQGKREATEGEYKRISVTYSQPMTAAVKLALEKEMAEDMVMMHAFHFISLMAPERIPLEYVVQYVTRCLPDQDEEMVAANIFSSSLILSSEEQSKEIAVHQVVQSCLQYFVVHKNKEEEFHFLMKAIHAFSALLNDFDSDNVNHIIATKSIPVHFIYLSKKLSFFVSNPLSTQMLQNLFQKLEYKQSISYTTTAADICEIHAKHLAANTIYRVVLMVEKALHDDNHPTLAIALSNLGKNLRDLGKHKEAHEYFRRALAIDEMTYDQNHPTLAITLSNLGNSLGDLGKHKEAQECFERALAIEEKAFDQNHPTLAITLSNLGTSLIELGKDKEAQECFERALAIQEKTYDENHPKLAIALSNLGTSLRNLGKHKEAHEYFRRVLAIQEMAYDQNHPTLAITLNNLGNSLDDLGKHKEAKECFERALAIQKMSYDQNHPSLAITLSNLGKNLHDLGKHKEAHEYFRRALAIQEMAYDQNHPTLAIKLNNLGNSLGDLGKHKEAKECFERALAIQKMSYDQNHPTLAITLSNLGTSLIELGKHKEAKECFERALAIIEKTYDQNHPKLAIVLSNLGTSLRNLGKHKEAHECFRRALAIQEMAYDQNHPTLAIKLNNLGNSLGDLGKHKEAKECFERALAIQKMSYDQNHPSLAITLSNLGKNLRNLGKHKEAHEYLRRALAIDEMTYGQNHPTLAIKLNNLGNSLGDLGKHKEAHEYFRRALAIDEMTYDQNHPTLAIMLSNLGKNLRELGKHKEAKEYFERALAIQKMSYDQNHPSLAITLSNLGNSHRDLGKHKEAKKCFERALAIQEMSYDQNHPTLAITLSNLGIGLNYLGKHKEAQECFERALAIREMAYDQNHPTLAITLGNLGNSFLDLGKHKEAQECFERASTIQEMAYD